ncbi:putative tyrosine-protein kinase [Echinococcus granulosus]|nr:putative tyrosine-protein kinase [Echinococcus granulosus]
MLLLLRPHRYHFRRFLRLGHRQARSSDTDTTSPPPPEFGSSSQQEPQQQQQFDLYPHYVCATRDVEQSNFRVRCGDVLLVPENTTDLFIPAKNPLTFEIGRVPQDAVTDAIGESLIYDAWQCIDRDEAVNLLSRSEIEAGTFILRPTSGGASIALTVRTNAQSNVAHYKIALNASRQYCLNPSHPFDRLIDLISYYIANPGYLQCTNLKPYFSLSTTNDAVIKVGGLAVFTTKVIGTGDFANVYCGSWHAEEAAVKCFNLLTPVEMLYRELQFSKSLDPSICVRVFDIFCHTMPMMGTSIIMAMELMDCGSLKHFLTTSEAKTMPLSNLMQIVRKIADGMAYLEKRGIAHTNLKDTNVLLHSDGSIKLADVGTRGVLSLANEISPETFAFDCWSAPELESYPRKFTLKSDVWAFGILGYVVLTRGAEPYNGQEKSAIARSLPLGARPVRPADLGEVVYNKLRTCWESNPEDRPSFHDIVEWMNGLDGLYAN